jgi:PAS domain-containing protein
MPSLEPLLDPLRDLHADELTSLRQRLVLRVRRGFRQGLGHWALGILLLAVSAGCIRAWWTLESDHEIDVLSRIEALLGTPHEPGSDIHTGLVSAVMTPINRTDSRAELDCTNHPACKAAKVVHHNFMTLVALASSESNPKDAEAAQVFGALTFAEAVPASEWAAIRTNAMATLIAVREKVRQEGPPFPAVLCPVMDPYEVSRKAAWGSPGCLQDGHSPMTHLIVPPRAYTSSDREVWHPRLRRAAWLSELLEPAVAAAVSRMASEPSPNEHQLVQAYFISADSLLRIWSAAPLSEEVRRSIGSWADHHYFNVFLQEDRRGDYPTPAYLDAGGYGVVRTQCSAIAWPGGRELIGVVCTDVKLPEDKVATAIADSPFFEVFRVGLRDGQLGASDVDIAPVEPAKPVGALASGIDVEALRSRLHAGANELSTSDVQMLEVSSAGAPGTRRAFFIPMASDARRPTRGLLVAPTTPDAPLSGNVLAAAGVSLFAGVAFGAASLTRARRASEYAHRLAMLRNLPVGVVEVNSDEDVLLANDRAEEVLGRQLPKAQPSAIEVNFRRDVIEELVVPVVDGSPDDEWKFAKYEQAVQARRQTDEWSSYYACLQGTRWSRWIRITAVPVLSEGLDLRTRAGGNRPPATFGIVEIVPSGVQAELRRRAATEGAITGADHA